MNEVSIIIFGAKSLKSSKNFRFSTQVLLDQPHFKSSVVYCDWWLPDGTVQHLYPACFHLDHLSELTVRSAILVQSSLALDPPRTRSTGGLGVPGQPNPRALWVLRRWAFLSCLVTPSHLFFQLSLEAWASWIEGISTFLRPHGSSYWWKPLPQTIPQGAA